MSARPHGTRLLRALTIGVAALCWPAAHPAAHPHAWIDVTVEVLFDKEGRVAGLRESWLFDDFYTAFIIEEVAKDKKAGPSQAELDALMKVNMENLSQVGYFTVVTVPGGRVALAHATDYATRMRDNRLVMAFRVPFETPVSVAISPLQYAIYDPSYYIEMLHAETADPIRLVGAPARCRFRLEEPEPNPGAIAMAAALDRTQSAGDGLGRLFAQWVSVRCD